MSTVSTKGLDKVLKALKGKLPVVRIGVLGGKDARTIGSGTSNASIGAAHEYGTDKLPVRSFLRIPLTEELDGFLQGSGAFDKEVLKKVVAEGSIVAWMKKVAVVAEEVVGEAFDTGGFGKWPISDMRHKKVQQTLVETQQLRNSITSEVIE